MTQVFIDPTKTNIGIQVTSQSLHALGFSILVFAADGATVIEQFTGDTKTTNPFVKILNQAPVKYKGCYVSGTFTVISPDGTDYPYTVVFSIIQNGAAVLPPITLSGTTVNGTASTIGNYHLN